MQPQGINFKKYRDFGELLGDTFGFIKQEFKFLMKVLFIYAGPFLLITAIAGAWYQKSTLSLLTMMIANDPAQIIAEYGLKFILFMLANLVSTTVLICVIYSYIGLYVERGKDGFTQDDVWQVVIRKFFPVLGTMIVVGILFIIGLVLCFIPGIYLIVSFCLLMASIFFENLPMVKAIERGMSLIKGDWWITFAIIIILYILMMVIALIFTIPSSIASMFLAINISSGENSDGAMIIYMILVGFGTFVASFISVLPHITFSLLYHSQIEKKESPGLLNKIEQINNPISENENKAFF